MSIPPPRGMSEVDYETIEAAVTETVRGRWFLAEFARRNRLAETRQLLDAMTRLETTVTSHQPALPSADPSIRMLVQRIKEVATTLGELSGDMAAAGIDDRWVAAVESQARAVAGMMRGATPSLGGKPQAGDGSDVRVAPPPVAPRLPRVEPQPSADRPPPESVSSDDARLAPLAALDALPFAEKVALFR